jgi:hypothetical protein
MVALTHTLLKPFITSGRRLTVSGHILCRLFIYWVLFMCIIVTITTMLSLTYAVHIADYNPEDPKDVLKFKDVHDAFFVEKDGLVGMLTFGLLMYGVPGILLYTTYIILYVGLEIPLERGIAMSWNKRKYLHIMTFIIFCGYFIIKCGII